MSEQEWKAVNRVGKIGSTSMLNGCWLVDPNGKRVATILDTAMAKQIAAAMNLTTTKQRTDWNADRAGYKMPTKR